MNSSLMSGNYCRASINRNPFSVPLIPSTQNYSSSFNLRDHLLPSSPTKAPGFGAYPCSFFIEIWLYLNVVGDLFKCIDIGHICLYVVNMDYLLMRPFRGNHELSSVAGRLLNHPISSCAFPDLFIHSNIIKLQKYSPSCQSRSYNVKSRCLEYGTPFVSFGRHTSNLFDTFSLLFSSSFS